MNASLFSYLPSANVIKESGRLILMKTASVLSYAFCCSSSKITANTILNTYSMQYSKNAFYFNILQDLCNELDDNKQYAPLKKIKEILCNDESQWQKEIKIKKINEEFPKVISR